MEEIWKSIPGFIDEYEVSNMGRVRSVDRLVYCSGPVKGSYWSLKKGRLLRPGPSNYGHLSVVLGRRNTHMVHTLVLTAFVGARPKGMECCHNNGVPTDNRLENLRWGTRSENSQDAINHGTRGDLSPSQVKYAREYLSAHKERGAQKYLADLFGVSQCTISSVKVGRHYANIA